jgi:FAD/FMN-containing dehydrogenase
MLCDIGLGDTRTRDIFGGNYEKLVELKRQYDPENVFNRAYNLIPGGGEDVPAGC